MISIISESDLPEIIDQVVDDINNSTKYMYDIKLLVELIECEFVQFEHFYSVLTRVYTHELKHHVSRILDVLLTRRPYWYQDKEYLDMLNPEIKTKLRDWLQRTND